MEQGYSFIAHFISNFVRQQDIRPPDLITDDLIRTFNEKSGLVQSCADAGLIELYEQKLLDLQNERSWAKKFYSELFQAPAGNEN